jgi:hypothetical protein
MDNRFNYFEKYQKYKEKYMNLLGGTTLPSTTQKIKTIVLIRHGEKANPSQGQLNCQGFNRAIQIAPLFLKRFGIPNEIYAPKPILSPDNSWYIRPIITIEPYAILCNKQINIKYDFYEKGRADLAKELFDAPPGTYVIAWEHHLAIKLIECIFDTYGKKCEKLEWPNEDFDSIYIMTYDYTTKTFSMKKDKQNLDNMPVECNFTKINTCDNNEEL